MKTYTLTAAEAFQHVPEHPERTARRCAGSGLNFDMTYRVWPNRKAMLKTIEMQSKREAHYIDWRG